MSKGKPEADRVTFGGGCLIQSKRCMRACEKKLKMKLNPEAVRLSIFFSPKRSTNKTVSRTTLLFSLSLLFCKTQLHFQVLSISCNIDRINTHHFVWLYTCIHPPTVQAPKTNSNVSYCIFLRQKNLVCSDEKLDTNWISCQDKWL